MIELFGTFPMLAFHKNKKVNIKDQVFNGNKVFIKDIFLLLLSFLKKE
jgi:hypothetical protein